MSELTAEERETRDETSARMAVHLAHDNGKTAGIVVDDAPKAAIMLERVIKVLGEHQYFYNVKRSIRGVIDVLVAPKGGIVRIICADRIKLV